MPSYIVTAPDGRKLKLTGDSPPSEAELEDIFSKSAPAPTGFDPLHPRIDEAANAIGLAEMRAGHKLDPFGAQDTEFTQALFNQLPSDIGRLGEATVGDVAAGFAGNPQYSGNLPALFRGQELPIEQAVNEATKEGAQTGDQGGLFGGTRAGTLGQFALSGSAMVPYLATGNLLGGTEGALILGAQTPRAIAEAANQASELGEEMGKPIEKQDAEKIARLKGQLGASAAGVAMMGHGLSKLGSGVALTAGDHLRLLEKESREGAINFGNGPDVFGRERLGIPVSGLGPNALANVPPDLIDAAMAEAGAGGRNVIGGEISPMDRIRGLMETQPEALGEPTAVKPETLTGQIENPLRPQASFINRYNQERLAATGEFPPNPVLPEEQPQTVTGPSGPYRRPTPAPTAEEFARQQARANVEAGLTTSQEPPAPVAPEPIPPAPGPQPAGQPLSKLQKSRLEKAIARGASIDVLKNILRLPSEQDVLIRLAQASQGEQPLRGQTVVKPSPKETGGQNAPQIRQQQTSGQPEHPGTALGEHVRPNGPEVRQVEGEQAINRNRSEPSGTELPKPKTEIEQLSAMPAEELLKQNRNITESAYGLAERVTEADIPKLEQAAKDAVADQAKVHEELAAAKTMEEKIPIMQRGMAAAMKNQFFVEAARMRRALDEAGKTGATTVEDFAKLEEKYGVGKGRGSATPGSMLKEMFERSKPPAPAEPEPTVENVTALEPSSGTPLSEVTGTKLSATDALIERLEALKVANEFTPGPTRYGFFGHIPHPNEVIALGKATWNGAVEVMIKAIRAGKSIADAIDAAIKHMKYNGKPFDESKMRMNLSAAAALEAPAKPRVEGTEQQTRKSAARAAESPSIPPTVQQRIRTAKESKYNVQPGDDVEEFVNNLTDQELGEVPKTSNVYVASRLELANRLFNQGKDAEGYQIFKDVSQTGTDFGQNINQFKRLKGANPANVVKLVNQGLADAGRDPMTAQQSLEMAKVAKASMDADKALEDAKKKWLGDPTDANAKAADALFDKQHKTEVQLQQEMNRYRVRNWPQMLKAFAQGNPLTPISQVANFVGNAMGAAMEAGTRSGGAFLDAVRSAITGGPRHITVGPNIAAEATKGFIRGLKEAPDIMRYGAGDVVKGETRMGLQPFRAFIKAFAANPDMPTVGGKVPFSDRIRLAVEGTFGIAPEIMLRMLAAADRPAYEAARGRLIAEQAQLHNVPHDQWAFAQRFPELFFTPDIIKQIKNESSYAVFQQPSRGVSALEKLIKDKGGDWGDLAFTLLVAPYKLTPWNLVGRTLIYNPLIAGLQASRAAFKGDVRTAEMHANRMMQGMLLYGAGYFLYKNGLIGPSLDTEDEQQKNRLLAGEVLPPNHVNLSGLKRLIAGGNPKYQPGDETWDMTRGGGAAGAILSSVANIGRDFEKKPKDAENFLPELIANSAFEQANFTINQSFLKGVTGVLSAIQSRNIEPYMKSIEEMGLNVGVPNTLSTLSRATRTYMPDLKGDSIANGFENVVRNRFGFAGLDDYLPIKRDLWGKPMLQTPEGRDQILYNFFDISKNKQVTSDPVSLELYDLWRRTASNGAVPSLPSRNVTFGHNTYPLKARQYERYAELVGENRRQIVQEMVTNPEWQNLDDQNKLKLLDRAYTKGLERGKALFRQETPPDQLVPRAQKLGFAE